MRKQILAIMLSILAAVLGGCNSGGREQVISVSAAISLKDTLEEIATIYEQEHPGTKISYNFASSGTLQKQIEQGAPADIYISAGNKQMDALQDRGLILPNTVVNLTSNRMVLIASDTIVIRDLKDLIKPEVKRIALGNPELVPAGTYAQEALQSLGLWEQLQPKLILTKDVRQTLAYVESGNVDCGIVYKTDALSSDKIKVIATIPADAHQAVVYPAAITKGVVDQEAAQSFLSFLKEDKAKQVFEKWGWS